MLSKILPIFVMLGLSLNAAQKKELNILLYGQTGSGKSTLINVFYNHMMKRKFEDSRDIIIPLIHAKKLEVNVDAFKNENVRLRPDGSSQTDKIRSYKIENENYIVTFWDTPGFLDTQGEVADAQNRSRFIDFLARTPLHSIIFILIELDLERKSHDYKMSIDSVRSFLPKSFFKNVAGVYNRYNSSFRECPDSYRWRFGKLFETEDNLISPGVYCINGSTLFERFEDSLYQESSRIIASHYWKHDREITEQLLLETKTDVTLNLDEVKRIQELQQKIQDAIDGMSQLFQLIEFQNSNLKILESKKGDFSEKIQLCKTEIEKLETERTTQIKELTDWQDELKNLAMKTHPIDAYVWYLSRLLSPLKDDFSVSKDEYARQKQVCQDWIGIYEIH